MPSIPQRLYNEVMMADNFTCVYCGKRTPDVGIDHIIPSSQGGPDVLHNLVAACWPCNARKSDHPLHTAGMRLLFGRFTTVASYQKPKELARPLSVVHEERMQQVRDLAVERTDEGWYRYSANAILKIVRGARSPVMAEVAAARAGQPVNPKLRKQAMN